MLRIECIKLYLQSPYHIYEQINNKISFFPRARLRKVNALFFKNIYHSVFQTKKLVPSLHIAYVYALLFEFPNAMTILKYHLTKLNNLTAYSTRISYNIAAIIIAETENFFNFGSVEKVLSYAVLESSVFQSGYWYLQHKNG